MLNLHEIYKKTSKMMKIRYMLFDFVLISHYP